MSRKKAPQQNPIPSSTCNKTILALDCSTKCTGWAWSVSGVVKGYGAFTANPKQLIHQRTAYMVNSIDRLVKKLKPDYVVIEAYGSGYNRRSAVAMHELLGAVKYVISSTNWWQLYAHQWRYLLGIKKNNDWKESTKCWVQKNFRRISKVRCSLTKKSVNPSSDVFDAIAILFAFHLFLTRGCSCKKTKLKRSQPG